MIDYDWGYKMGFKLDDKVKNAREILKTLGYTDEFIEEEGWKDLSKEKLHENLLYSLLCTYVVSIERNR